MPERLSIHPRSFDVIAAWGMVAMLIGFSAYIVVIVATTPGSNRLGGLAVVPILLLFAEPFRRIAMTRLVANEHGLHLHGGRAKHYPWSDIAGFHIEKPKTLIRPLWHFGPAIHADFEDGTSMPLYLTMARQMYRPQKDLERRLDVLNAWVDYARTSAS